MDLLRAFILGVVQALTEFLPISSSAHLILFRDWLGFDSVDGLLFDVTVHIGTVSALVLYFRRDLASMGRAVISSDASGKSTDMRRVAMLIVLANVPAALAGYFLDTVIEEVFRHSSVIVVTLVAGGALFLIVERVAKSGGRLETIGVATAMIIGFAQSVALIPGVSRSGITIAAGMFRGLDRAEAARFSFLLSIPIILGAGLKESLDIKADMLAGPAIGAIVIGYLSSALAGWVVIKYLLRFLQRHRLDIFSYYRFALATAIALWLFFR